MSKNYPERRSIRLRGYDYSQDGLYFITICTYNREPIFGRIANGKMQLNDAGIIARDAWLDTARIRPNVVLGDFVVMPNHFHAVFAIDNTVSHCRGVLHTPVTTTTNIPSSRKRLSQKRDSLYWLLMLQILYFGRKTFPVESVVGNFRNKRQPK